ncbi:MAG TPA: LamG domain-containing protein [Nitrososphaeraceae archaeon]|nr:LamG domain-containing protein [Nitrososphaeraceae archaeon]
MNGDIKILSVITASSIIIMTLLTLNPNQVDDNDGHSIGFMDVFAQDDKLPVVKNSQILPFSGQNYADVKNSETINLNSFTVSTWFNTNLNATGKETFLINKGGTGSDKSGSNLNYGIFLTNREKVRGGFETPLGDDYLVTSQSSYNDGQWHSTILTFDEKSHILKLYMDGIEVASNSTKIGVKPDSTGKQPIRLGANSLAEKGKITGNYTGQLDDIQVWNFAFTNDEVLDLFKKESQIQR